MEIIVTNSLISINATFFIQLVSFLIFLYVINRIMFRPLLSTIEQRAEYIDRAKDEILTGKKDLDQLIKTLDKQRVKVIKEATAVVHLLETEGDRRATDLLNEVGQEIVALRHATEDQVKAQVKHARKSLEGEVAAISVIIMEKVLHRRLPS